MVCATSSKGFLANRINKITRATATTKMQVMITNLHERLLLLNYYFTSATSVNQRPGVCLSVRQSFCQSVRSFSNGSAAAVLSVLLFGADTPVGILVNTS